MKIDNAEILPRLFTRFIRVLYLIRVKGGANIGTSEVIPQNIIS